MSNYIRNFEMPNHRQAKIIISDDNWLEQSAIDQLKKTMELPGMCQGIGMPDLHPGKGQPIGAAFITKNRVYPHLVGSDIGCGMGVWQLDIPIRKVNLDKWEKRLTGLDDLWDQSTDQWLTDNNVHTSNEFLLSENNKLGTIGGGNHFAELQQVCEIFDSHLFAESALDKQAVMLLAHSGSRGLGQKILRAHTEQLASAPLATEADIERYMYRHNYAVKWAVANRSLIAERFCSSLNTRGKPILDITHNMVSSLTQKEAHTLGLSIADTPTMNIRYWIHRKGASPTDKGLVMIPGSRGSLSYLVKPKVADINSLAEGGFSLAHGAGRKWKRSDVKGRLQNRYKAKDLERTALGSRVICKQKDLLYEEAPEAYKNISRVIDDLVGAGMVDIVASFKPLLTYKTRRV